MARPRPLPDRYLLGGGPTWKYSQMTSIDHPTTNGFYLYERLKAAWVSSHPKATPLEYQQAMRLIAKRLGL